MKIIRDFLQALLARTCPSDILGPNVIFREIVGILEIFSLADVRFQALI